uniref:Gustatory receptor n=1 Tax=Tetranychus urticae TaxID=32264 RepID=T1L4S9_TETUR
MCESGLSIEFMVDHKPNGILAHSLQTASKTRLILIQVGTLLSFLDSMYHYMHIKSVKGDIFLFLSFSWNNLHKVFYFFIGFYLIWKRSNYNEFINYLDSEISIRCQRPTIKKFIRKNRKFFSMYLISYTLYLSMFSLYLAYHDYLKTKSLYQMAMTFAIELCKALLHMSNLVFVQFIVESCLYAQVYFKIVHQDINCLKSSTSHINAEQIYKVRKFFCGLLEKTRKLDLLFGWVLLGFYSFCFLKLQLSLAVIIDGVGRPFRTMLFICESMTLIIVTYHVVYISHLSDKCFDPVYSLSYKLNSLQAKNEVQLLLDHIGHSNAGLTLLKVVPITPTFVTSIVSLTLTIVTAFPSLLELIKPS